MSRIHDALKKAEIQQLGYIEDRPQREVAAAVEELPAPSLASMPSFSLPLTADALLERTTTHNWHPSPRMLFFEQHETAPVETFRTLRSRLYQIREKSPLKKLLIAGASAGEGTSFIAANLAQAMAQGQGQRALLIDGDLRKGDLHIELGAPASPGLTEYLTSKKEELAVIQRGPMENLFFLASGEKDQHPLEMIVNGRMSVLLNRIEPIFEWIIFDSSPANEVSDASQLARYCDAVLLVVRSSVTPSDLAARARDEFFGKKILGTVLNGV